MDWLRVLAMLAVFLFHSSRFFGGGEWHLNNGTHSLSATIFIGFLDLWLMPLFFLITGVGSWYALERRTGSNYLFERAKRLLIPFYTVGLLILIPPQFYFEMVSNHGYKGTFLGLLPIYIQKIFDFKLTSPSGLLPMSFTGHFWFLKFLFLISFILLPLMLYLKSALGRRFIRILAGWCGKPGGIYLFIIPQIVIMIGTRSFFRGRYTWAEFLSFALLFLIGYLIPADKQFNEGLKKLLWIHLILGIIGMAAEAGMVFGLGYQYPKGEAFSMNFVLFQIVISLASFSWIFFIVGMASRYLNFNHTFLQYSNEAVLPFYIFHQTIILCVGWFVIQWRIPIFLKYSIIVSISFFFIMLLYEIAAKRTNSTRFLFGMRPKS
ncbi:MAG: acyltransferase family protein [Desulfobacterales bacterium]